MESLSIGALASQTDVGIDTIRYYERRRLIAAPPRRASGYRAYPAETVQRLRFIRRAKTLGFTLEEISELLTLSQQRTRGVKDVKTAAQAKLARVEAAVRDLQRVRAGLKKLIDGCPGHGAPEACPILKALNDGDST
ncbi:MAG: MerR family DNA-binding protein [Pseudomonadota bacterium]